MMDEAHSFVQENRFPEEAKLGSVMPPPLAAARRPPRSALPIEFLVLSQSFLFRPQCISLFIEYLLEPKIFSQKNQI